MNVSGVTVAVSAELAGQTCVIHIPSTGLLNHSLAHELRLTLQGQGWVTLGRKFDTSIKECGCSAQIIQLHIETRRYQPSGMA